jgi:hypothetical protein
MRFKTVGFAPMYLIRPAVIENGIPVSSSETGEYTVVSYARIPWMG